LSALEPSLSVVEAGATAISGTYFDEAAKLNAMNLQLQTLVSEIQAKNAQRYLILDLNAGGAYLANQSVESIIKSTAKSDTSAASSGASASKGT